MRDPVTGFEYPNEWQEKCRSRKQLADVARGLAVLTASGSVLRRGYTTGTTAAAACMAAILSLKNDTSTVRVTIPCGLVLDVPVVAHKGTASCRKYAGDYPGDATAGIEFVARASVQDTGVNLVTGDGIGTFVRDTPRFKKGTPAITPAPLGCILQSMQQALDMTGFLGITVNLSVPGGAKAAKKTLNSRVGVKGGISVLGTTGLVEPWDDHLTESVLERISAARRVVLTTGRTGLRYARLGYPEHEVVLVGSKIGDAVDAARGEVILFGLPALILKYIDPGILNGTGFRTIEEMSASVLSPDIVRTTLKSFHKKYPDIRVVIVNRQGAVIGETP